MARNFNPQILLCLMLIVISAFGCAEDERQSAAVSDDVYNEWVVPLRQSMASAESAGGGGEVVQLDPTGWATITGRFVYDAPSAPVGVAFSTTSDPVCGAFNIRDESLMVNANGMGLANVFVYLRTRGFGDPHESYVPGQEIVLANNGCRFEPHALAIWMENKIKVTNEDPTGHNTNCTAPGDPKGSFNESIPAGAFIVKEFGRSQPRPNEVKCSIHPWMSAKVLPRENPYFATTDADGNFRIENVPAGIELEFQVLHELSGNLNADASWNNGRFKVTLQNDETHDMGVISVGPALFGR